MSEDPGARAKGAILSALTSPAIGTATNPSNIYDSTWAQTIAGIEGGLEQLLGKEQLMALRETLNRIIAVEGAKPRPH